MFKESRNRFRGSLKGSQIRAMVSVQAGTFVDVPDFAVLLMSLLLLTTLPLLASVQMVAALILLLVKIDLYRTT
jgi:hypothetical protein